MNVGYMYFRNSSLASCNNLYQTIRNLPDKHKYYTVGEFESGMRAAEPSNVTVNQQESHIAFSRFVAAVCQ